MVFSFFHFSSPRNLRLSEKTEQSASITTREAKEVLQLLKLWDNEGTGKHSSEDVALAVQQVAGYGRRVREVRSAMIFLSISFVVLLASLVASVVFALRVMRDQQVSKNDVLLSANDGNPLRVQQHFQHVALCDLPSLPLEHLENMQSLVLQWGEMKSEDERKFYFTIESAMRDGRTNSTILRLSSDHQLVATEDRAILYNEAGDELGVVEFYVEDNEKAEKEEEETHEGGQQPPTMSDRRRLGKKRNYGRYPTTADEGLPESFFDAYCRYGCGGMAVTFPYYYRPFFGYGFPLVGTESMFPQGYGGYPAAEVLASQGGAPGVAGFSGPVLAGGQVAPMGGMGATTVSGGPPTQAVALPNYQPGAVPAGVQGAGMPIAIQGNGGLI